MKKLLIVAFLMPVFHAMNVQETGDPLMQQLVSVASKDLEREPESHLKKAWQSAYAGNKLNAQCEFVKAAWDERNKEAHLFLAREYASGEFFKAKFYELSKVFEEQVKEFSEEERDRLDAVLDSRSEQLRLLTAVRSTEWYKKVLGFLATKTPYFETKHSLPEQKKALNDLELILANMPDCSADEQEATHLWLAGRKAMGILQS